MHGVILKSVECMVWYSKVWCDLSGDEECGVIFKSVDGRFRYYRGQKSALIIGFHSFLNRFF